MRKVLILILLLIILQSCEPWKPKTVLPEYFRTIHIPKFENKTMQPQLTELISRKVINKFELDGRLTVSEYVSRSDGILFGSIVKYEKVPLSYTDIGEIDVNALTIRINIKLKEIKTKKELHNTFIEETTEFNFKSAPVETELEAQERLIDVICSKIVSKVIEGW